MAVLDPLKVVITNYPEGKTEEMEAVNNPEDPNAGARTLPFSRELYIEQEDFREDAPKKFFRLVPAGKYACVMPTSLDAKKSSKTPPEKSPSFNALMIRRRAGGTILRTGVKSRERSTGFPPAMPLRLKCGFTIICLLQRIRPMCQRVRTFSRT